MSSEVSMSYSCRNCWMNWRFPSSSRFCGLVSFLASNRSIWPYHPPALRIPSKSARRGKSYQITFHILLWIKHEWEPNKFYFSFSFCSHTSYTLFQPSFNMSFLFFANFERLFPMFILISSSVYFSKEYSRSNNSKRITYNKLRKFNFISLATFFQSKPSFKPTFFCI